jgi:hypothetical protein
MIRCNTYKVGNINKNALYPKGKRAEHGFEV